MTDFGKVVKTSLIQQDKTMKWLVEKVKEKTGMYFDSSYLAKIVSGRYENQKIITAIKEILNL